MSFNYGGKRCGTNIGLGWVPSKSEKLINARIEKLEDLKRGLNETLSGATTKIEKLESKIEKLESEKKRLREALDTIACKLADVSTSKDFTIGNARTYLNTMYIEAKSALERGAADE